LKQATTTLAVTGDAFASDGDAGGDLAGTLIELKQAARSLHLLTDYLDGHPESLILGKSPGPSDETSPHRRPRRRPGRRLRRRSENRYYTLSVRPPTIAAPAVPKRAIDLSLAVVHLPGVTDRPQLVVRTGAETVDVP